MNLETLSLLLEQNIDDNEYVELDKIAVEKLISSFVRDVKEKLVVTGFPENSTEDDDVDVLDKEKEEEEEEEFDDTDDVYVGDNDIDTIINIVTKAVNQGRDLRENETQAVKKALGNVYNVFYKVKIENEPKFENVYKLKGLPLIKIYGTINLLDLSTTYRSKLGDEKTKKALQRFLSTENAREVRNFSEQLYLKVDEFFDILSIPLRASMGAAGLTGVNGELKDSGEGIDLESFIPSFNEYSTDILMDRLPGMIEEIEKLSY